MRKTASSRTLDNIIHYLNTDLDLQSTDDLRPLVHALNASHITGFDPQRGKGDVWYATVSMPNVDEPEQNIADMLSVIENLARPLRRIWNACSLREFNIGYDCGKEPWAFNQGLSAPLLARIAALGASLRLTLYPDRSESGDGRGAATACASDANSKARPSGSARGPSRASRSRSAKPSGRRARPLSKAPPPKRRAARPA